MNNTRSLDTHGLCDPIRVRHGIDHESVILHQGTDTIVIPVALADRVLEMLATAVSEVNALAPKGEGRQRPQLQIVDVGAFR